MLLSNVKKMLEEDPLENPIIPVKGMEGCFNVRCRCGCGHRVMVSETALNRSLVPDLICYLPGHLPPLRSPLR